MRIRTLASLQRIQHNQIVRDPTCVLPLALTESRLVDRSSPKFLGCSDALLRRHSGSIAHSLSSEIGTEKS